jgi:hypothetical protein
MYIDQNSERTVLGWLKNEEGSYEGRCEEYFAILVDYGSIFVVLTVMIYSDLNSEHTILGWLGMKKQVTYADVKNLLRFLVIVVQFL